MVVAPMLLTAFTAPSSLLSLDVGAFLRKTTGCSQNSAYARWCWLTAYLGTAQLAQIPVPASGAVTDVHTKQPMLLTRCYKDNEGKWHTSQS